VTVSLNGDPRELPEDATVADLVRGLGHDPARPGVAVAVNGELVPRVLWARTPLAGGDRVEIVTAVQGG
jgi:sulfur carrier protein